MLALARKSRFGTARVRQAVIPRFSMIERRLTALLPLAFLAIACTTLGLAWVVESALAPTSWLARLGMVLGGGGLLVVTMRLALVQSQTAAEAAERYIKRLCELDSTLVQEENALDLAPCRKEDARWRDLAQRVRQRMAEFARQADEIEMARAGVEVRFRRLAAERDQLREILMNLADPVLAIDAFGQLVVANTSAEKVLDIHTGDEAHPIFEQLQKCQQLVGLLTETRRRKTCAPKSGELALATAEGKERFFRVNCRTLTSQQHAVGGERGAVAVLTDISGQKAIQKRNAEFVSAVSHEMKTPLSSIRAYVELLVDGEAEDDATREEFLGVINSQADRLQRLIDNLLNLARIEAGVVAVNKSPLSLNELLAEAVRRAAAGGRAEADHAGGRVQPAVPGRAGRSRHAAAGGDQPALQRRQVHARRRPRHAPQPADRQGSACSRCRTPAWACRPKTARRCSKSSIA